MHAIVVMLVFKSDIYNNHNIIIKNSIYFKVREHVH